MTSQVAAVFESGARVFGDRDGVERIEGPICVGIDSHSGILRVGEKTVMQKFSHSNNHLFRKWIAGYFTR